MFFIHRVDWMIGAGLFMLANIGVAGTLIFCNALLPHVAGPDGTGRVSTAGYALGCLGGEALLAVNLAWIQYPQAFGMTDSATASRWAFLSVVVR